MHQAGYQTFMAGKWHLGMADRVSLPSARGFDQFFGFYGGGINYYAVGSATPVGIATASRQL